MEKINTRVALVSMPVLSAHYPSFQLGLLKPTLEREGIDVQTFCMYMYFGAHVGFKLNSALSEARPCIASEWIWAKVAFGDVGNEQDYIDHYRTSLNEICEEGGCTIQDLLDIRNDKAFSFIDFCVNNIDWSRFQIIGFSIVFQQMAASLALAEAIKKKHPDIAIILGGPTFEDDIAEGIMKGCPYVDYLHCGDADRSFPEMIHRFDKGQSMEGLKGLIWRKDGEVISNGRSPNLIDMDTTPIPDFDEYFYAFKESGFAKDPDRRDPMIPIESARGCWWGMRNHCTFCGLNRAGMDFRAKSTDNVMEMLKVLSQRYQHHYFNAIDNIMENEYIEKLFGKLADDRIDFHMHYEVRPHFSRQQLARLKQGGLHSVQPGVESFNTHVLKLMRKMTTAMRNVAFVKWCTYYNINNLYNILYGFPGETEEDYDQQSELIDIIPHLQPPYSVAVARPERGSPMFTDREKFSITEVTPAYCYYHIYPQDRFDLQSVAYYYYWKMSNLPDPKCYQPVIKKIRQWRHRWETKRPTLRYRKSPGTIHVEDNRNGGMVRYRYTDREAKLFEYLNDARTEKAIAREFDDDTAWIEDTLADFEEKKLVVHLDKQYLNVSLPVNPYF
ncbi:MAG: RiPP maturation radical SAM protein 1 [bacterium]|nr:RiPP maturation radical SAM protein 1 [bacterium]